MQSDRGSLYSGVTLAVAVLLNIYILLSRTSIATDEPSFLKSMSVFLNLSSFAILAAAVTPEQLDHNTWFLFWIGYGIWFFIKSPYALNKHKNRVEYFYNLLESGIDSADLMQQIPPNVQNAQTRADLREQIFQHKRTAHEALENYRWHFRTALIAQPGITEQYADAYLEYNRDTLALMHLRGVTPEKAARLIFDDLQARGVRTDITTAPSVAQTAAATATNNTPPLPVIAAPTQSEIDVLNDILMRPTAAQSEQMRHIQAYMTLPSNHDKLGPAKIFLDNLVRKGIVQDENNPVHRDLYDLQRIVTLGDDGRYHLTGIAAAAAPQPQKTIPIPQTIQTARKQAQPQKLGWRGQAVVYSLLGLFLYSCVPAFNVSAEVFVPSDTWRYIGHSIALPVSLFTAIWVYPRAFAEKFFPQAWGVFSFFLLYFMFWSALVSGGGEVFTELTAPKELSIMTVSKDLETNKRVGRHGRTTAYCVQNHVFKKTMVQKSFCRIRQENYDVMPDDGDFPLGMGIKKSPLGTVYTDYMWPQKAELTKENFRTIMNVTIAVFYIQDKLLPRDPEKAAFHLQTAAEDNNADAQFLLGALYLQEGTPLHDEQAARQWMLRAAEQKHPEAMSNLGLLYFYGQHGFEKDMRKAFEWTLPAAQAGESRAQVLLSIFYSTGKGEVKQNIVESVKWAMIAEMRGNGKATDLLATLKPSLVTIAGQEKTDKIFEAAAGLAAVYQQQHTDAADETAAAAD
ncbi:MAG: sel1 repeat family protein [Pseudomonadota bacterium]|nr:MAG: sel1 repeat family protein [Pseudomonadota bacterium]